MLLVLARSAASNKATRFEEKEAWKKRPGQKEEGDVLNLDDGG